MCPDKDDPNANQPQHSAALDNDPSSDTGRLRRNLNLNLNLHTNSASEATESALKVTIDVDTFMRQASLFVEGRQEKNGRRNKIEIRVLAYRPNLSPSYQ